MNNQFTSASVPTMQIPTPPYPGTPLSNGSSGADVGLMQRDLNAIRAQLYPNLNLLVVDGLFGNNTQRTVGQYQAIKGLAVDGIIGRNTWNAIVTDYASLPTPPPDVYPGTPLRQGSKGPYVLNMQARLNEISVLYTAMEKLSLDGIFGQKTADATRLFQKQFGLNPDEVIGELTWNKIVSVSTALAAGTATLVQTKYPGTLQQVGSSGDSVRFIQSYMSIATGTGASVTVDGLFGPNTKSLVMFFQNKYGLKVDGIVGSNTWTVMILEVNKALS